MRSNVATLTIVAVMLGTPVRGDVVETNATGFSVRNTATINAPSAKVYAELTDKVGGFRVGGFRDMPAIVDAVLRGQLARLKAFVETGRPDGGSR